MNTQISSRSSAALAFRTWLLILAPLLVTLGVRAAGAGAPGDERQLAPPEKVYPVVLTGPRPQIAEAAVRIGAVAARQQFNVDGSGLAAAVLDTGIKASHQDFPAGKILEQHNYTNDNAGVDTDALDGQGHGSHVSGIIASNGPTGSGGHTGIAPGAKLVAMKVLPNQGLGNGSWLSSALQYLIDNHTRLNLTVANLSLGSNENLQTAFNDSVRTRIAQLRAEKVAVVISAGNAFYSFGSAQGMSWPAIFPECVSVGAVYDAGLAGSYTYASGAMSGPPIVADQICAFSQRLHASVNAASSTDIFAPGADIISTGITSNTASAQMHGTSQAAPVVAGVILLMQQYHLRLTGQLPSIDDIESWLVSGAADITDGDDETDNVTNTGLGFHRISALGSLQAMQADLGGEGNLNGHITAGGEGLEGVTVSIGGLETETDADGYYEFTELAEGQYTVTPSLPPYVFTPVSRTVTVDPNATNVDFTGAIPTYTVSGSVRVGTAAVAGATVSAGGKSVTTQTNGTYTIPGLTSGTYEVAVSKSGYRFSPANYEVTVGPNRTAINFTATKIFSISGTITVNKLPLTGVTVTLQSTAGNRTTTTEVDGTYSFDDVAVGSYKLVPTLEDYLFTPASRAVRVTTRSLTGTNFAGAVIPDLTDLTLAVPSIKGSRLTSGTVTLSGKAPVAMKVALLSSNSAAARVAAFVTIPKGKTSARVAITTRKVLSSTPVTLSATLNGVTETAELTVTP